MTEALFVSVVGEEVVQVTIQQTLEPWPALISVHRDIICWMSSSVSHLDFVTQCTLTQAAISMPCAYLITDLECRNSKLCLGVAACREMLICLLDDVKCVSLLPACST